MKKAINKSIFVGVWIIIVLAVSGYFANSCVEKKAKREAENTEAKRIEEATRSAVSAMVSRTGAVDDWERNLSKGERFGSKRILTVDLERLWLQNRPILFIGFIKDIATYDEAHYTVLVERSLFNSLDYMFDTELEVSLRATKSRIDSFLEEHPSGFGFADDVAVIADVKTIQTAYIPGEEGGREEVKIGEGELIDIIFLGEEKMTHREES